MAENRRGKDRRYFFSRGQMVLLGGTFTVAAVVIFVLGMLVGKGIEERKLVKRDEPAVRIPVPPSEREPGAVSGGAAEEKLTFYDTLSKSPAPPEPKQAEKSANVETKATQPPAKADAVAPAKSAAAQTETPAPAPDAAKLAEKTETAERAAESKEWTVQVNAYPDERSAKLLVDQLRNKGYKAVVTEVLNKGKTWYRVRVGRYGSREEADKFVEALRTQEGFTKAFATSR